MDTSVFNMREQLLANLKFLYGKNVEILMIYIDGNETSTQAIATTFDSSNSTLTKHLHGNESSSHTTAMRNLLLASGRELGKLLSENGHAIPFQSDMLQTLTLRSEQREDVSSSTSQQSEFIFVQTPGSSVVDEMAPQVAQVEGIQVEEYSPAPDISYDGEVEDEAVQKASIDDEPAAFDQSVHVSEEIVLVYDHQAQDANIFTFKGASTKRNKKKKKKSVFWCDEPPSLEEQPTVKCDVEELGTAVVKEAAVEYDKDSTSVAVEEASIECEAQSGHVFTTEFYPEESRVPDSVPESVEPVFDDDQWGSLAPSKNPQKKEKWNSEVVVEPALELEAEPMVVDDYNWDSFSSKKSKKGKSPSQVMVEPIPDPEPEPEPVIEDDSWGSFVKGKSKRGRNFSEVVVESIPEPEPEPIVECSGWAPFATKNSNKMEMRPNEGISDPVSASEYEPVLDAIANEGFDWEFPSKKDKRKNSAQEAVLKQAEEPIPEPESVPEEGSTPADDPWASWAATNIKNKKKKRKNRKVSFENGELQVEDTLPTSLTDPEPVISPDSWSTWRSSWGISKKNIMEVESPEVIVEAIESLLPAESEQLYQNKCPSDFAATIGEPAPVAIEPVPRVDEEDEWMNWGRPNKKDKKKKSVTTAEATNLVFPEPDLNPQSCAENSWRGWGAHAKKQQKSLGKIDSVAEPTQEILGDEHADETSKRSERLLTEGLQKEMTATAPETSKEALVAPLASIPKGGQTIVFTIRYPNLAIGTRPLEVMLTLKNNTRAAIFDAVNAYLDSKDVSARQKCQRSMQIRSGVGRNGEMDLSGLEGTMWPDYIEYFCQYTKLPELTIDVVDV